MDLVCEELPTVVHNWFLRIYCQICMLYLFYSISLYSVCFLWTRPL